MTEEQLGKIYHTARNAETFRDFKAVALDILSASIAEAAGAKPVGEVYFPVTTNRPEVRWLDGFWPKVDAKLYAAHPAPSVADIEDPVIAPRDLLIAACSAIDKKRNAPNTLAALRAITMAPRTAPSVADAAGASEGQEPACWITRDELARVKDQSFDSWVYWAEAGHAAEPDEVPLYTHPSAEIAALRERIAGMEKDADLMRFLDVAAAEGYVFDGVDAGDLYQRLFPDPFDAAIAKEPK